MHKDDALHCALLHHPSAHIKHAMPDRHVINVLVVATATFNHTNMLKLTGALVHTLLFIKFFRHFT